MNSALCQSDLLNVMPWQDSPSPVRQPRKKEEKKHLVNHSGCISITEEKWNGELKYSDPVSLPKEIKGLGRSTKVFTLEFERHVDISH